jgi:hypothetical protein
VGGLRARQLIAKDNWPLFEEVKTAIIQTKTYTLFHICPIHVFLLSYKLRHRRSIEAAIA